MSTANERLEIPINTDGIKGFLDPAEANCLYRRALHCAPKGVGVEIGSYCGKSTIILGAAFKTAGAQLIAVDHHRGSEENQPGWEYHDPDLWDEEANAMDTLPYFRRNLRRADLEDTVIPIIGKSSIVASVWSTPISLLFIDGGHTLDHALNDYCGWSGHVMAGGILAIHDVFPNPEDGGRPPFEIYQMALSSNLFEEVEAVKSLRILRRNSASSAQSN